MNIRPTQLTVFSAESFSLVDACQPAMRAIIAGDMSALQVLIGNQHIRAGTRTPDGSTMLMQAVRHGNIEAFQALSHAGIDAQCLECTDTHGENVFFSLVRSQGQRFETDDVNVPGFRAGPLDAPWREAFTGFFKKYAHLIDWDQTNWDEYGLYTLANDLAYVKCADFLERYMLPRALDEHLEGDDSLCFSQQDRFSLIPSSARATHAIASGDITTLGRLIVSGDISASTLTPDGEPLSVFCLKCGQLEMFKALVSAGTSTQSQLTRVLGANGSLVHSMIRGVDDGVLALPSSQPQVRAFLVEFFNLHHEQIDWTLKDREERDPVTLAESLGLEGWAASCSITPTCRNWNPPGPPARTGSWGENDVNSPTLEHAIEHDGPAQHTGPGADSARRLGLEPGCPLSR